MRRPTRFAAWLLLAPVLAFAGPHEDAAALIAQGQFLAAERIVEPLTRVKRPDARSLFQLSQIRLGQLQADEAIRLAERAIKADPGQADYFAQLGLALQQQLEETPGGYTLDRIRKTMEQAVKLDPRNVPGLVGLSKYYSTAAAGLTPNYKLAEEFATRAAQVDAFAGEMELARIAQTLRQYDAALAHLEKAIAARPGDAQARYAAALVLLQLKRKDEARARLQEALQRKRGFKDAQEALDVLDAHPEAKNGL